MLATLTGTGLSAAAGLNAYIPFLMVALIARFTDVINLPSGYAWIESWWSIGISSVLLLSEIVLDKVAVIDHINDTVATLIRPTVGGLIFAATTAADDVDRSAWMQQHPWVPIVLGVLVAGLVHAGKATARPVVNTMGMGMATPVVSAAEDGTSLGLSLLALFAPIIALIALIALVALIVWGVRVALRIRRRPAGDGPRPA